MNTVDLSPLTAVLLQVLVPLLTAAVSGAAIALLRKWKLDGDDTIRQYVLTAVENGVHYGVGRAAANVSKLNSVDVKSQAVAAAVNYVIQQVPDAVKKLKLDPSAVQRMVEARLSALVTHNAMLTLPPPDLPAEGR